MEIRSLWASHLLERRFAEGQVEPPAAAHPQYSMGAMSG
jgi:hypothetical protein